MMMQRFVRILSIAGAAASLSLSASAQQGDTLRTKILEAVVVMGTTPASATDTLQRFFKSSGTRDTEELVSRLNGFSLVRRGAFGQEPVIRGLSQGQINVTVDGMKLFGACTDRMDPVTSYTEGSNVSALQGLSGNAASEYGSTFGGALNIALQKPAFRKEKISGEGGIASGTAGASTSVYSSLNLSQPQSAYRVHAAWRRSDNYRSGGGEVVRYSQYKKLQISGSGKWRVAEFDTLSADVIVDRGWDIGFPALPMDVGIAKAQIYALTYQRVAPWWFLHSATVKAYHNRIFHTMDDTNRDDIVMHMDMPGQSMTSGMFAEGDVHVFHDHRTFMKAEFVSNKAVAEMTMYPTEGRPMYLQTSPMATLRNAGYYIQQFINLTPAHKMIFSVRADVVRQNLSEGTGAAQWRILNPDLKNATTQVLTTVGLSAQSKLSFRTRLEADASYGERMATLQERFGYFLFSRYDGFDYLGNPDLKKETAFNTELTLRHFGNKFEIHINPFYKLIRGYVTGTIVESVGIMTPGANGVKQYTNLSYATIYGGDILVLLKPASNIQWINTIKYTHGTDDSGLPLPLMPPLKAASSIKYTVRKLAAQVDLDWSARQMRVSPYFGETATSSWWTAGLNASYRHNSKWTTFAGVANLFDRRYRQHMDWGHIPREGRNIHLSLVYRY